MLRRFGESVPATERGMSNVVSFPNKTVRICGAPSRSRGSYLVNK